MTEADNCVVEPDTEDDRSESHHDNQASTIPDDDLMNMYLYNLFRFLRVHACSHHQRSDCNFRNIPPRHSFFLVRDSVGT